MVHLYPIVRGNLKGFHIPRPSLSQVPVLQLSVRHEKCFMPLP